MIVTATADQVAELPDGRIVIAKPGFNWKYLDAFMAGDATPVDVWTDSRTKDYRNTVDGNPPPAAPDDLVAVTEPCQTCRGTGWDYVVPEMARKLAAVPRCSGCVAGRPLFDLKVECGDGCPDADADTSYCPRCDPPGFVTHAGLYVPGPLLPVVAADLVAPVPSIVIEDDWSMWINDENGMTPIDLPSAARPGWYAVIAEQRKT